MSKLRELHGYLPDYSIRALGILRNTSPVRPSPVRTASPGRSRSPRHDQPMAHPDLDTLVSGRQRPRHRRPQETPAPPAHCALPGSWNKDFLQELAQWTPTSGPGEHLQLKTRLGIINHWRNGTSHIQGPSSHQLACRIVELREALQQETRAPVPHNHSSQAPMAHLVGNCANHVPAPDTSVPSPGPHPLSPASFSPGSSTRFQQNTPASSRRSSGRERDSRSTIFPTCMTRSCRLKVTQVNPKVSGLVLVFCLCVSPFPGCGQHASHFGRCGIVRAGSSEGLHRGDQASLPEVVAANTLFEEAAGAVWGAQAHSGSRRVHGCPSRVFLRLSSSAALSFTSFSSLGIDESFIDLRCAWWLCFWDPSSQLRCLSRYSSVCIQFRRIFRFSQQERSILTSSLMDGPWLGWS